MSTITRITLPAALAAIVLLAASCSKDPAPAADAPAASKAVVNTPQPAQAAKQDSSMPSADVPERVSRLLSSPADATSKGAASAIKLNTTTPENFVTSLQAIERESSKENVDDFRAALTIMQLQTQQRISRIASESTTPPQFSDAELMEIAFSEINGMTLPQVVAHAKKIAPDVVPQQ